MKATALLDVELFELNEKIGQVCGALNEAEEVYAMQTPEYTVFAKVRKEFVEFMHLFQERTK